MPGEVLEDFLPASWVLVTVGGDGALVDVPGHLDGEMVGVLVEHVLELREMVLLQQPEPLVCSRRRQP